MKHYNFTMKKITSFFFLGIVFLSISCSSSKKKNPLIYLMENAIK